MLLILWLWWDRGRTLGVGGGNIQSSVVVVRRGGDCGTLMVDGNEDEDL